MKKLHLAGLVLLWAWLSVSTALAQEYVPALGPAFLEDEVATVRLTLSEDDWAFILNPDNAYSNQEWPATFVYESSAGIDTVENVGMRLRGNTSREAAKKSFKVSFNTFTPGASWNGLEKLNLNGNHNDPSMLRARMVWEFMRAQGHVAPRVSHVRVYVNGEYRGLYINVEHVDEEFIQKRFKHDDGNLWKCTYPGDLAYLGEDPEAYKLTPWWSDQRVYELKTNTVEDDYSAIAELCTVIGTVPDDEFECALEAIFDVDAFLKTAAMEILVGHWDNYIGNHNNYYLYERPTDGRLMMISYDVDNTLGIEWGGGWATHNVYQWDQWGERPLYERVMGIEQYRTRLGVVRARTLGQRIQRVCLAPTRKHPAHVVHVRGARGCLPHVRLRIQRRRLFGLPHRHLGWARDPGHRLLRQHARFLRLRPNQRRPIPSRHPSLGVHPGGGRHLARQGRSRRRADVCASPRECGRRPFCLLPHVGRRHEWRRRSGRRTLWHPSRIP